MTVRESIGALGQRLSTRAAELLALADSQEGRAGALAGAVRRLSTEVNKVRFALGQGQGPVLRARAKQHEAEWRQQQHEASREVVEPALGRAVQLLEGTAPARVLENGVMDRAAPAIQGARRLAMDSPREAGLELDRLEEAQVSMHQQLAVLVATVMVRTAEIEKTHGAGRPTSVRGAMRVHEFSKLLGIRTKDLTRVLREIEPGRKWVGFNTVDPLLQLEVREALAREDEA